MRRCMPGNTTYRVCNSTNCSQLFHDKWGLSLPCFLEYIWNQQYAIDKRNNGRSKRQDSGSRGGSHIQG